MSMLTTKTTTHPTKGESMKFFEFLDRNNELGFGVAALFAIAVMTLTIASCDKHNTRVYATNGYQQVQLQGSSSTMWVKK